jgi:UDP-N-acetylmuramate dehydrogenase
LHSLTSLHTFGLEANAQNIMTIESTDSLFDLISQISSKPYLLIGEGSNLVFTEDYAGLVIKNQLKGMHFSEDEDYFHINVASGENWHELVSLCMQKRIYGFENLALIPGTVGASPIQNIGAYGVEIDRYIQSVEFIDISSKLIGYFNRKECEFAYRDSRFKREPGKRIITSVNFALPKQHQVVASYGPLAQLASPTPEQIFEQVVSTRKTKLPDPAVLGNAGSFFKNPTLDMSVFVSLQRSYPEIPHYRAPEGKIKLPAAWLIEQLGFKGQKRGDIGCHDQQALVLVNYGKGTGSDLLSLARDIRHQVLTTFGIELENEVRLIGKLGPIEL